ncbi:hypothetical protein H6G97_22350 [Nostoc flagelliforme FACHB-838]|uniref:Uncharacterized protein n=1 Tax=Nostoc flagelliforme FACHB-838 TaxID=2692904 RepID=A0ABR8DSJ8_9NOSO|nr:hypothetical protein [Nostoc flagelliforme]MBD2532174.1 hypothetical protein [Nostoc flagelliforme FACHB-838]
MIISDLNYLENTSEEIIVGGGNTPAKPNNAPKTVKFKSFASAQALASALGLKTEALTATATATGEGFAESASASQSSSSN